MTGPAWTVSEDQMTLTVSFPSDPPVALELDAAGAEELLAGVGLMRSSMLPEIAKSYAGGQKVEAIVDPGWYTEPSLLDGATLLHIRDPRYGWLHYLLPPNEAKNLSNLLSTQAALASTALQPGPKTN